jgi:hypothetical protein
MALDEDTLTDLILDSMADLDKKFDKTGKNADRFPRAIARAVIQHLQDSADVTTVTVDLMTGEQIGTGKIE